MCLTEQVISFLVVFLKQPKNTSRTSVAPYRRWTKPSSRRAALQLANLTVFPSLPELVKTLLPPSSRHCSSSSLLSGRASSLFMRCS
ncbi:hypothetical protein GUJ93_ZPchr0012g20085 [Zizania palustris]|uniref:Uncharacterized protein n=1 Tax=Zizania palustris TaxID=103762 RepID=A0A8J6BRE3_ZIZPA|nr:hypothetical protein GUJ93_ZPchr0012g20085 [Zizania palustris]